MGLYDSLPENSFTKKVLAGENPELVENLLKNQQMFAQAKDKEDKTRFKERLSHAYWEIFTAIAKKATPDLPKAKRLLLRYGVFDMKYLSREDQEILLSRPFEETDPEQTIFYLDEWLIAVGKGQIKPSMTDESPKRKKANGNAPGGVDPALQAKYERLSGVVQAEKMNYDQYITQRKILEDSLTSMANMLVSHPEDPVLRLPAPYNETQMMKLDEMTETIRELKRIQKSMAVSANNYSSKFQESQELERQIQAQSGGSSTETYAVDSRTLENEAGALRQMQKMCVGRQGNHFPILASAFIPKETRDYNFKTRLEERIKEIETMDNKVFERVYRQTENRIPPYIILMPGYGNAGICWEPYDKYNKATSKGRIAVPIFTRQPDIAVSMALGDFRWQVAKELASYHWMDEGLTGRYYQFTQDEKIKGDIKSLFIDDYILWLTKEAQGIQKLHKEARYIFWRFVPFPDEKKEELSMKGYYYNELWKKEQSFRMSQGY